jgi:ABC-2 type transport system permease protein
MRVITLAFKDIKQLFQSWQTAFFLLIMPVVFTLMFGFMFGGMGGDADDPRLLLGVMDHDRTEESQAFIELLERSDVVRPILNDSYTETTYRKQVEIGDLHGTLVLPEGFGDALTAGETLPLVVVADEKALTVSQSLQSAVQSAYARMYGIQLSAGLSLQSYQLAADPPADEQNGYFSESLDLAAEKWQSPPVTTVSSYTGADTDEEARAIEENAFIHSSPGMMAQFAIAGLIGAAELLVSERRSRALSRMLTTGFSRMGILTGHFLAMSTIIFLQLIVLMVFGQVFLGLDYLARPLATLLVIVAAAAANGALGLLIGSLAKTSETAIIYSLVPMFLFSGLGGAWTPLEFTSESVQFVSRFTPVAWMMEALKDILARGSGLETVWLPVVVLLGFAVLFFSLGAWRFKFE